MRPCVHTCVPRDCHLIMSHFATKALDPTYLADASRKLSFTFPKCTPQVDSPRMSPKTASGFIDQGFIFRRNCHEMFWTRLTTFHQSWHGDGIVFPILGPLQHRQPHTKARTSSTQNQPLKKKKQTTPASFYMTPVHPIRVFRFVAKAQVLLLAILTHSFHLQSCKSLWSDNQPRL